MKYCYTAVVHSLVLSFLPGYHPSNPRLGVASWDQMLSKIMVSGTNKGTCGDHCFVTLNGETKVFPIGESIVFTSQPCTSFICTVKSRTSPALHEIVSNLGMVTFSRKMVYTRYRLPAQLLTATELYHSETQTLAAIDAVSIAAIPS